MCVERRRRALLQRPGDLGGADGGAAVSWPRFGWVVGEKLPNGSNYTHPHWRVCRLPPSPSFAELGHRPKDPTLPPREEHVEDRGKVVLVCTNPKRHRSQIPEPVLLTLAFSLGGVSLDNTG